MSRKLTTEGFIEKAKSIHGDRYVYDKTKYTLSVNKITVICRVHGNFEILPTNHIKGSGCKKCGTVSMIRKTSGNLLSFISKSKEIHCNKYDYSESKYVNNNTHLIISCKIHGDFYQLPCNYISGKGCQKCALDDKKKIYSERSFGWNYSMWGRSGKESKNFDSFKVYILKCWGENEEFYKVGKTFNTIKERFRGRMPYKWVALNIFESDNFMLISKLENEIKSLNKEIKYSPKNHFDRITECFKTYPRLPSSKLTIGV